MPSGGNVSDSSDNDDVIVGDGRQKRKVRKQGRKAEVHESERPRNVSKRKRNSGLEYISVTTKKLMPARKVGPACRDGCYDKIGRDNIEEIHKCFWGIGNDDRQNEYLMRCVSEVAFKRKYTKKDVSKRPAKLVYTVTHASTDYEVCREGFMNIFDIKRGKLDLIVRKIREARAASGVIPQDQRGKTVPPVNKIAGPKLQAVHEFIGDLPVVSSHYTRAKAPLRQYLPAGGSIAGVYAEFQVWMALNHPDVQVVSEKFFRTIFTTNYDVEFAPPRTDECHFCSEIDVKIGALKNATTERKSRKEQHLKIIRRNTCRTPQLPRQC
ncbi:uncharacterized protein LOC135205710 isoform X1 [Macrobrachium nipponense]|uniref:uncharacterized protein LOC135205710 isoform X1 n=1 Tax=Macrobrachium nipponense TaxID=159736 RepID=UPI0030C83D14